MTKKLKGVLLRIGLNEKESAVYLASLLKNESTAAEIAKHADLNRVSTYDQLERLIKRGFIHESTEGSVKKFSASEPEMIMADIKARSEDFEKALPDFQAVYETSPKPQIRHYDSMEAIKTLYSDTLTSKTEILNYANSSHIREHWPNYDEEYVKKRIKNKIYLRGIAIDDELGKKIVHENSEKFREIRLIPKGEFEFKNEINIYDDKLAIISFHEKTPIGMLIKSQEIADMQRAIFMMSWAFADAIRWPAHKLPLLEAARLHSTSD